MLIVTNLIVIFLVLLIAYWWASQGLFSALLHLVCVLVAGAIALAFWEPFTYNVLMRGGDFDDYAWGVSLVGLFAVTLFVLRIGMDKAAPSNVNIPTWANFAFGFPVGVMSGIVTVGILAIGMGFMQSHKEIGGYQGYGRSDRTAQIEAVGGALWMPVHKWTSGFYEYLSDGALYPTFNDTPLIQYNPDLYRQSALVRDSYDSGSGKLSLLPEAASVGDVRVDEGSNRHAVEVNFEALARDFGEQLTLSSSQIRLICSQRGGGKPTVVHPDAWHQETDDAPMQRFLFDNLTHYITSIPGRESARVIIEFPVPQGETGRFIQIRGTRYELPRQIERVPAGTLGSVAIGNNSDSPVEAGAAPSIDSLISVTNSIRPLSVSTNQLPSSIDVNDDKYLTSGTMTRSSGRGRITRSLMVQGIEQPPGTQVVQLDVSRGTAADIFGPVRDQVDDDAVLAFVDNQGNTYSPIGYLHKHREGTTIRLDPQRYLRTAADVPVLPTSGTDSLKLIFRVTQGARLVAFRFGEITIGTCNVQAVSRR